MSTMSNGHPKSTMARTDVSNPSTEDWVNVFGPNGYNVQPDNNRNRKLGRVHLPDVLKVCFRVILAIFRLPFASSLHTAKVCSVFFSSSFDQGKLVE